MSTENNNNPLSDWLAATTQLRPNLDITLIEKAANFSEKLGVHNKNIIPLTPLQQGLEIASILTELNCDSATLASAIAYPAIYYHRPTTETLSKQLGSPLNKLLRGVLQMETIRFIEKADTEPNQQQQLNNLRKMLLAMVDDIRIVLIKLAERLMLLKNLRSYPGAEQIEIAKQVHHIYAPLANRLGIGQLKWQLEDLSFRYLNPENYKKISKALNMKRIERETYIQNVVKNLQELLKDTHIKQSEISGRAKHIYSIYRKIERKKVDISEIYDASAVRILVPSIEDCYAVLGIVHATWPHIKKEFDDYLAHPKPNGYRSIHTAVIGPEQKNIEIQIRTFDIHNEAELGVTAHWKYKETDSKESNYEEKIDLLRQVMDWQKEVSQEEDDTPNLLQNIFSDRIYVFTPKGDIIDLKEGATGLDLAYHIHTDIGHRCRGVKIHGVLSPLTHPLKTGDCVEIMTSKEPHPSRDWLNAKLGYLRTHQAKTKVQRWFKHQAQLQYLSAGQLLWDKVYRREGLTKADLQKIAPQFNFKTGDDVLIALGANDISIGHLVKRIKVLQQGNTPIPQIHKSEKTPAEQPAPLPSSNVIVEGVSNLLTQLARCCQPIPDDPIIGYITQGRGITIHRKDCANLIHTLKQRPERAIKAFWHDQPLENYTVDLKIIAENRSDLLKDLSAELSNNKVPIIGISSEVDPRYDHVAINLTITVQSLKSLHLLIHKLKSIPGIIDAKRRK